MPRKSMTFRMDTGLIARVDAARGDTSRTEWLEGALEARLAEHGRHVNAAANYGELRVVPRAVRPASSRVVSSSSAKAGVVPRWRGTDGSEG